MMKNLRLSRSGGGTNPIQHTPQNTKVRDGANKLKRPPSRPIPSDKYVFMKHPLTPRTPISDEHPSRGEHPKP